MNFTGKILRKSHIVADFCLKNQKLFNMNSAVFFQRVTIPFLNINKNIFLSGYRNFSSNNLVNEQGNNLKKRLIKRKKLHCKKTEGFRIMAYSTAEEYNLENLLVGLPKFTAFEPTLFGSEFGSPESYHPGRGVRSPANWTVNELVNKRLESSVDEEYSCYIVFVYHVLESIDVVHAVQTSSEAEMEHKDIFFFREGSVVLWNVPDSEIKQILTFLKDYEDSGFADELISSESESMSYNYSDVSNTHIAKDSLILSLNKDTLLEKYAVSNAMALSVHLGAYEANLEQYITTMEPVTEDLKGGIKIKMSRNQVLQKTGQLFALRHNINLSSDLLDTPDFYWDREELEVTYQKIFNYYCINKRTKVINEKINHCIELVDLLSSHVNDKHHVRLEWMIILLIMVEVGFEIVHYAERYLENEVK